MASLDDMPMPGPPGVDENETRQPQIVGWAAAMMVVSLLAVVLRFVSRYLVKNKLKLDDWLAVASLPFAWAMCLISLYGVAHDHFGQHIGKSTLGNVHSYLIGLWVFDMTYGFAITLSKLSIIALWWRIFEVKSCHVILAIVAGLEIAWLVATTLVTILSCDPVRGFWDLTIPSHCIVQSHFWVAAAIPNIVMDIFLLVIPNFYIARLSISLSQRLGLSVIFMLGIFVTICSGLRLWQLIVYNNEIQTDLPWATSTTAIWSFVEGNLSVVCCCLPSMRPLLRLLTHGRAQSGDYMSNRGSRQSPITSGNGTGMRNSKAFPVPMQTLNAAATKKAEWWETSPTDTMGSGGSRGNDAIWAESWPLPAAPPTVRTAIQQPAKQQTSGPMVVALPAAGQGGGGGGGGGDDGSVRAESNQIAPTGGNDVSDRHSRRSSRNRTMAWSGWLDNMPKPVPAPANTWLQLDDSAHSGSSINSPKISLEETDRRVTAETNYTHGLTHLSDVSALSDSNASMEPHAVSVDGDEGVARRYRGEDVV